MREYTANNGTKVTILGNTLTCVREGLIMVFPNVKMTYVSKVGFIADNGIYKVYPELDSGKIESFNIEKVE
jgi:hypothetical protein